MATRRTPSEGPGRPTQPDRPDPAGRHVRESRGLLDRTLAFVAGESGDRHHDKSWLDSKTKKHDISKAPSYTPEQFWDFMISGLHDPDQFDALQARRPDEPYEAILTRYRSALHLLNQAVVLLSVHRHRKPHEVNAYYTNRGLSLKSDVFTANRQRFMDTNGPLETVVFNALRRLPGFGGALKGEGGPLHEYMRGHDFRLEDLMRESFRHIDAARHPRKRASLQTAFLDSLDAFFQSLERDRDLTAWLQKIVLTRDQHAIKHDGSDGSFRDLVRTDFERQFERSAPRAKIALERLFVIKGLSPSRVCRFLITPEGQDFCCSLGNRVVVRGSEPFSEPRFNRNAVLDTFFEYVSAELFKVSAELRHAINTHPKFLAVHTNAERLLAFLVNDSEGQVIARALQLDFKPFQEALSHAIDGLPFLEVVGSSNSFKEWNDNVVLDKSQGQIPRYRVSSGCADKVRFIADAFNRSQKNPEFAPFWEGLSHLFEHGEHGHSSHEDEIKALLEAPAHKLLAADFKKFSEAAMGRIQVPELRTDMVIDDETRTLNQSQRAALRLCRTVAVSHPVLSPLFSGDSTPPATLKEVLDEHLKRKPPEELVDFKAELKSDILAPLACALGFGLEQDQSFNAAQPGVYLIEKAFTDARKIQQAIQTLRPVRATEAPVTEAEPAPKDDHHKPEKAKPTLDSAGESIAQLWSGTVDDRLKKKPKKAEKKKDEPAPAAAPKEPPKAEKNDHPKDH